MPKPLNFQPLKQTGNQPTARSGHTITTVGKTHVMFGGLDATHRKNGKLCPNNEVYTIKVMATNVEWRTQACQGEVPLARTNHAACAIGQDKLFIFGGYYTSNLRFNDVYILKLPEYIWKEPPNQKSGTEPKNTESKIGAPEPRANHTCSYHAGKVYVFGGHGGCGYQRTSFNDLYVFDCDTSEWTKLTEIGGSPPLPRGGHTAGVLAEEDKLLFYGGWSQTSQHSDVMIYDIKANSWVDPELSHETPRWCHVGLMVAAIPSWKYFIFGGQIGNFEEGGNRTVSQLTDLSYFLDIRDMKWNAINLEDLYDAKGTFVQKACDNKPKARENSAMFFDANDSRLVIFGGWANNWLQDMVALNVSSITGPSYAIYAIKPSLGPLTGKTRVVITGEGFKDTHNIAVKFDCGKGQPEAPGNYISATEIWCETPSFEQYGPRQAEITLKIGAGDYTITSSNFIYFLNTDSAHTIAYGPGLLKQNAAGHKTVFAVQARNTKGENRESGADVFQIKIIHKNKKCMVKKTREVEQMSGEVKQEEFEEEEIMDCEIKHELIDNNDGTYDVEYLVNEDAEDVEVTVQYQNPSGHFENIRGTPFHSSFKKGLPAKNNEMSGPLMGNHINNTLNDIDNFITNNSKEINIKNKNIQDVFELLKVKESLQDIQAQKEKTLLHLDVIEEMLAAQSKQNIVKENDIKKVKKLKTDLNYLQNMSTMVEKDISGQVKGEGDKAQDDLQKFDEKLKEFYTHMKKEDFYKYGNGAAASQKRIKEVLETVHEMELKLKDFEYFGRMFNFSEDIESPEQNLAKIKKDLDIVDVLWTKIINCQNVFNSYQNLNFLSFDCMEKDDEVKTLRKGLNDIKGFDKKQSVFTGIMDDIKKWAAFLPLCGEMRDPAMETSDSRHWNSIKKLVNKDFTIDETLKIKEVWELELFKYKDDVEDITDQAKQELKMEKAIQKIIEKWQEVEFESIKHKDTNIFTLKMQEENFEQLEEHQMQINNMLLSKYIGFFEKEVEQWKLDLGAVYDVVQLIGDVQKTWSFLENLFIQSEEVKKDLPKESEQFIHIDKNMKTIMEQGNKIKNVLQFCTQPDIFKKLDQIDKELKVCEQALNDFLDGKRRSFPRFYFVSQAGLLDILSNGNSPEKINKHMSKIFQAVDNLELEPDGERPKAKTMISCVGVEKLDLTKPMKMVGKVESYLADLIHCMRSTLNDITKQSVQAAMQMKREEWLLRDPAQVTILVNMMSWSRRVEECFDAINNEGDLDALKRYQTESNECLTGLIKMVQGKLDRSVRQKVMVLITMDTHSRDVNDRLIQENVRKMEEFQWQSQLKSYFEVDTNGNPNASFKSDARINICDAVFYYAYEYLGNGGRLVITPLTDRIYVTATQALHLKMGCAPAGPAGTGKTESTKDLSNAVSKACYVFNCSGEMNYESMGNIFKGLASSGCWGCFDEFNRLWPEVLSVCSVQFKAVCDATKQKQKGEYFTIEGDSIILDPTCGVFITMNPGYLGRSELPEGLKALFRPITVVVPQFEQICENMLMAEGFVEAKLLARKFVTLFSLCKDLLSKSMHYDWGLRAIKSVLNVAGAFKRSDTHLSEDALLMRALRDFNIPKIIAADLPVFFGLLGDLFPKIEVARKRDMEFEKCIVKTLESPELKLYADPDFVLKVVQLRELLEIRWCVFVMGPPGSGKTRTWQTLAKSSDNYGLKHLVTDMNPKVVSTKDLYGYTLPSKEWKDGLLSKLMRNYAEIPDSNAKWIVLDGDLDANWIESMNSVMDDNRILTLANNERIPLKTHMRLIFEIRNLKFATPATVSRAGILYISDDDGYQWRAYIKSWLNEQQYANIVNPEERKQFKVNLQNLFDKYIAVTFKQLHMHFKFIIPVVYIQMVVSLCKQLQTLLNHEMIFKCLEYVFVYALVWAVGGVLCEKDGIDFRREFSIWWKAEQKSSVKFPSKGTVFDYYVEIAPDGSAKFQEWNLKIKQIEFDSNNMLMNQVTVPTRETVSTSEFIKRYLYVQHPVLLIGNSGCGKTALALGVLREIVQASSAPNAVDQYNYQVINFNNYTDSQYLQNMLEQQLVKKAGKQYGPSGKMKLIYFVDDLNMPQDDGLGTQTAIALLRQAVDMQHWYDIGKLSLKEITNTQHFASMNPSAGSFYVNPRYQRNFWITNVPFPDNESLFQIFNTFLSGHLKSFRSSVQEQCPMIIKAALQMHTQIVSSFRKTAINFHYEFNIRHLSNVFEGLLLAQPAFFQEPEKIVKLWIHESERSYCDRLVTYENIATYKQLMCDIVKKTFTKNNFSKYFQKDNPENLIFCNFTQGISGDKQYDQILNDNLKLHINEALREYNDNNAIMNLVLFEDAMKHVCRITRIVMPSQGHALLVGVGGSGKQSLSKLASYIMGFTTYSITISSTYSIADLKTDIQNLYFKTGVKQESYLFMFTEGQIANERFLVYINDLLSSGEIADLYTGDEKEVIVNQLRAKCKAERGTDNRDVVWTYFIDKVKANLHMALCFSPVGESFRRRARQFPALVNCTTIDWYQDWPYEALLSVSENFLANIELNDEEIRPQLVEFMPYSFKIVNELCKQLKDQERRAVFTTPKSFLELIQLYTSMLGSKKTQLEEAKDRYESGLIKLQQTQEDVKVIEEDVKVKQVEAEEMKQSSDIFAEKVGKEKKIVEAESSKANIEAEKCGAIKTNVEQIQAQTKKDLDAAIPLVEQAKEALNSLTKNDFTQVKSYATPPKTVPDVFQATQLIMAGFWPEAIEVDKKGKPKGNTWKECLKMMKNPEDFMNRLIQFKDIVDANQANPANMVAVQNIYLVDPDFTPEVLSKKSSAATGICKWVINIIKYWEVIQQVEPTRKKLKEASEQLEVATVKLNEVMAIVNELNSSLATLEAEYDAAIRDKNAAMAEAARCERRLNLAQRLVQALGSENERWGIKIQELESALGLLVGDSLLASAFISYAGPFNKQYREKMINQYFIKYISENKIPMTSNISPIKLLTDEATIALWNQQGLPVDPVSVENGTILTSSQRYPLIIDPQLQGITWIKEKEKDHNLKCVRLGSKNIVREIELCIENGWSALIENMGEKIDAIFMPVICRATIKRGNKQIMKFGGKDLQLHKNFKLFMQTKLSNPFYPPEIQAEATMINFTVTEDGLCDQLLTLVVSRERPDLSKMKNQMIQQQNDFKIKLKHLEDDLLYRLATAKGDILDDIELIENLEKSKRISVEVGKKVEIIQVTETKINEMSENYRPAASRGALIYFLMTDLAKIHQFYKYSLESFINVMNRAIDVITEKKEPEPVENKEGQGEEAKEEVEKKEGEEQEEKKEAEEQEEKKEGEAQEEGEKAAIDIKEGEEEEAQEEEMELLADPMSPRSLGKRVTNLIDSITLTAFNYTRRGLLEKHKLIVSTMLTLRILLRKNVLSHAEVEHLTLGKFDPAPPPMPEVLRGFVNDQMWANCKALEQLPMPFNNFTQSLEQDYLQWKKWYNEEKAEDADLPKAYKEISRFHKLLLLRAMRPDRLTNALNGFIFESMGEVYVEQSVLDIDATYLETSSQTPIFFVLFPGVEPSGDINFIAQKYGFMDKKLTISMGQGQEGRAQESLLKAAKNGHWICLENLHLMQNWLYGINGLEGFLEQAYALAHPNFRAFFTSEPPTQSQCDMDIVIIPESLLQSCIKVSNENPQDLKANLRRAYSKFDQAFIDKCTKPNEFKSILFALCFFHSVICGRKKFGSLGWSKIYNFNDGDLTICADVLFNYIQKYDVVPYQDLKYIFGEIMYGGHITDDWDRRTNNTYLEVYIKPELLCNMILAPQFRSPDPAKFNYEDYRNFIETKLPAEQPIMFGLHPNAEINYLTSMCDSVFNTIMNISGKIGGGGGSNDNQEYNTLMDYKNRLPTDFNLNEINDRAKEKTPNVVVCMQECERMNKLLGEIRTTLEDLRLGITGALNMSDSMELLSQCLTLNKVPASWEGVAYFSKKLLANWFTDLLDRVKQLQEWSAKEIVCPKSLCISYLFNPMSFLTAVMQNTARLDGYPLDNMALQTTVTQIRCSEDVQKESEKGAYVHGLFLEGATWELGGQGQQGYLIDQKIKDIHPKLPVVLVEAVPIEQKKTIGQYKAPVYVTSMRGPTFIFCANLNMENDDSDPNKWVLSGTCVLMSDD